MSVSSDGGTKNQGLAKELGITIETPCFTHPCREGWVIYWFWDPVHILKRLRDHLIDKGYILPGPNKTVLDKNRLKRLIRALREGGDISIGTKLSEFHVEVRQQGKITSLITKPLYLHNSH